MALRIFTDYLEADRQRWPPISMAKYNESRDNTIIVPDWQKEMEAGVMKFVAPGLAGGITLPTTM